MLTNKRTPAHPKLFDPDLGLQPSTAAQPVQSRPFLCHSSPITLPPPLAHLSLQPSQPQNRPLILLLQQLRLPPQRIRLKPPKRPLDPVPPIPVRPNLLPGPERPRQQPRLAAEEQPAPAQQAVRRDVAQRAGLHRGAQVRERRLFARREAHRRRLLGVLEGFEERRAVAAQAEGEEGSEREAEERADARVRRDGARGFLQRVAVGLLEAARDVRLRVLGGDLGGRGWDARTRASCALRRAWRARDPWSCASWRGIRSSFWRCLLGGVGLWDSCFAALVVEDCSDSVACGLMDGYQATVILSGRR